jgi:hypothetical protein
MRFASARDFMQIPVRNFRPETSATPPSDPVVGQMWVDTSVTPAKVRWYNGSAWTAADGTSIPAGFITDTHISATANIALSKLATDPLARGNHTGQQPASTISDFADAVRTNRLDQLQAPTVNLDLNGQRLVNVATPVAASDAATKGYVDNARAGISVKDPVRVALRSNVNLNSPGTSLDGVDLAPGDRFLAAAQNTGTDNGIYVYNGPTEAATRAGDADGPGEVVDGSMVAVAEGAFAGYQFIQTNTGSGAPGTWTQGWVVFTMGGQTYTAGTGLVLDGTRFSLEAPVPVNLGGTGAATAVDARANIGALGRYATDLGAITAGSVYTLTHGLGSVDVGVWFRTLDDNRVIDIDWAPASPTALHVYSDMSFAAGALRAVVIG